MRPPDSTEAKDTSFNKGLKKTEAEKPQHCFSCSLKISGTSPKQFRYQKKHMLDTHKKNYSLEN